MTFLLWCHQSYAQSQIIKIACIGNSITYGYGVPEPPKQSYPAQLQVLLGDKYEVANFGVNGATLLQKGNIPFWTTEQYKNALKSRPDIVLIELGTNDSKLVNRIHINEFVTDYENMVKSFTNLPSHPRIILLLPVPSLSSDTAQIWDPVITKQIIPRIQQVAYNLDIEVINLYSLLTDKHEFYSDEVHPDIQGLAILAKRIDELIRQKRDIAYDIFTKIDREKKISSFYGYLCADFTFNGRMCKIVKPKWSAISHPWVWRARFWGHEPQTDIALLEHGFHIAYCDAAELFGNQEAVDLWNSYYKLLKKAGLSKKSVLEGMSRGGVYVFNWAAVNRNKIACVYADNPVLNLKSWPCGLWKVPASDLELKEFKDDYHLKTDDQIKQFKNSPVDNVKQIVKGKYPILILCADADEVVPPAENTLLFEQKVKALSGNLTIMHKINFNHHPHSFPNPSPIVDFILKSTLK